MSRRQPPLSTSYSGVGKILKRYWRHYGGTSAVLLSPYFHFAFLAAVCLYPYWMHESWWDLAISCLPSLLGFSLGGFAIWLGFGDRDFRTRISVRTEEAESSAFMQVSAAFAHFVILQIVALFAAIIAQATQFSIAPSGGLGSRFFEVMAYVVPSILAPIGYFLGFLLFCYALVSALAAGLAVFRVASWFDEHQNRDDSSK